MWQNLRWEINAKFKEKIHRHVSSFQVIILGFMLVILLGSLCLTLPWPQGRTGRVLSGRSLYIHLGGMCDRTGAP